ncbi:hypothetical protein HKX48_004761 [Thoreauomyces humboldtii]|nr:hypothetical protein HKX48_004761 [Thoreauomyces humboldtii]
MEAAWAVQMRKLTSIFLKQPATLLVSRIAAPAVTRGFAQSASVRADFISNIYLEELRKYTPPKATNEKVDLPTTFTAPAAPPKPELDTSVVQAAAVDEAVAEEAWPAVYNPIDDPANYPDEWDFTTDNDDGNLLPQRLVPVDYTHH